MMIKASARAPLHTAIAWILRLTATPIMASGIALLLVAAGLISAVQIERIGRAEKFQQTQVQARILASGIAAPLAFDDKAALEEYLNATRADPQILAVGAYDAEGRYIAGYSVPPARLPGHGPLQQSAVSGGNLIVTAPVVQGSTVLGSVYVHASFDSWPRRATRYLGIAAIVIMASLMVAVLGVSYASLREAHGKLQDETESRLQAEEALRQAQKMEALGQLTGGVAHDFNNLLMAASGSLDLMETTSDPAKLAKLKLGMRQAIDRGAKLTQQLLTFARRSPLRAEVVDLAARVRGMDTLLERLLTDSIAVETHLAPDLWPVEVDPSELEVALLNIALNARDAMSDGGVIEISARNAPDPAGGQDMVRLAVRDTGTGIPPEALNKIFEPFYTTKGVGRGTGLGLSQVYGFARASGGDVLVESVVGEGTTVALLLPRSLQAPVRQAEATPVVAASAKRCIFLVEDDDIVAEMVGEMLSEIGYDYERAINGDAALARLQSGHNFGLVLSDMIMPGKLSGVDLVHEIRRNWPKLPTVLMSGYSTAAASALDEGIRLISKPFSLQTLSAQLDAAFADARDAQPR